MLIEFVSKTTDGRTVQRLVVIGDARTGKVNELEEEKGRRRSG